MAAPARLRITVPEEWERWVYARQPWERDPERPIRLEDGIRLDMPRRIPRFWLPDGRIVLPPIEGGAREWNGAVDKLANTSFSAAYSPMTCAIWGQIPLNTVSRAAMETHESSFGDAGLLQFAGATAGDPIRWLAYGTGGTGVASTTTGFSVDTWHHLCGANVASNSRKVFIDGGSKGTNSTNMSGSVNPTAVYLGYDQRAGVGLEDGTLAEAAIWSVALSDADIALAAKNVSPLMVHPESLIFYAPIIGNYSPEVDVVGHFSLTVTNTSKAVHPRIFYPSAPQTVHKASSANQTVTPSTLALTTAAFAPTVTTSDNKSATPSVLAHSLATFAPTVTASDHKSVTPGVLAHALSAFAPSVVVGVNAAPDVLALALASFAPTIVNPQSAEPGVLALSLATFAPTLDFGISPDVKALLLSAFAPGIETPVAISMASPTALLLATFAPVAGLGLVVTPTPLALALTTYGISIIWPLWHPPVRVLLPEYRTYLTLPEYISRVLLPSLLKPTKLVLPEYMSRVALEPYTTSVTIDGRPL